MPAMYLSPALEYAEEVRRYRFGGHHPVNLLDILDQRYKVIHKLGHGGFATIWLARSLEENQYVAVKINRADAPNNELKMLTYLRDHSVKHSNIASLKDAFAIHGPNGLHQCLEPMIRKASQQIAEAVAHLHSTGICHGDLTNSNVLFEMKILHTWSETELYENLGHPNMSAVRLVSGAIPGPYAPRNVIDSIQYSNIDENGLTGRIQIIDFGVSFFTNDPPIGFLGTPVAYIAPEIQFGWTASTASDVWTLGCLIFELQASRPMIIAIFGSIIEALGGIVRVLDPLPKDWRPFYFDKSIIPEFETGKKSPWFDRRDYDWGFSLEDMIGNIRPNFTAEQTADFLVLLRAIFEYQPSDRLSAKQIAEHPWFTK